MEVNGVFSIPNLDSWQGSYSTGAGASPFPRRKKPEQPESEDSAKEKEPGVHKDGDGVVHVDLTA